MTRARREGRAAAKPRRPPSPLYSADLPKAFQLEHILRTRLAGPEWGPGTQIPPEVELGRLYGVSRVTVRRVLARLEADGLVSRFQGRGTIVAKRPAAAETVKLTGSLEDLMVFGRNNKVQILERKFIDPSPEIARRLSLGVDEQVFYLRRIRYVDGEPLAYVLSYLVMDVGLALLEEPLEDAPIITALERRGVRVVEVEQAIESSLADLDVANLLSVRVGTPIMHIERIYMGLRDRPVAFVRSSVRGDRFRFLVTLRGPGDRKTR